MPEYDSKHWDREHGSCVKHGEPCWNCPRCINGLDEDLEISLSLDDLTALNLEFFEPTEARIRDLFPVGELGNRLFKRWREQGSR
ncbi:MAG: hypothetical protein Q7S15_00230 [bacterium]|nr:hypothetical protein [bacterium]